MPRSRKAARDVRRVTDYSLMTDEPEAEVEPTKDDDEVDGALWEGIIGVENQLTGDGRLIELNALRWDNLPLPFRHVAADSGAHAGAVVVGRITHVERQENGDIYARGDFDMDSEQGREAARQVAEGLTTGVSMDLDDVSFELRLKGEVYEEEMLRIEKGAEEVVREKDDDGRVILQKGASDDEVQVTTDARIRAATLLSIPAFEPARIALAADDIDEEFIELLANEDVDWGEDAEDEAEFNWVDDVGGLPQYIKRIAKHLKKKGMTESHAIATAVNAVKKMCATGDINFPGVQQVNVGSRAEACAAVADWERKKAQAKASSAETITASGYPVKPPKAWFLNPDLSEPTPLRVTEDGRVFGHLAQWGTCHIAYTDRCVQPPESASNYARYRLGYVVTKEGDEVPIGHITMDTLHAARHLSAAQTMAHYENTGRAVADVAAGEDAHGIWIAGALRPGVTPEQVRALRASPLSGDWRDAGGVLELVAALACNVPGFPIPRPQGLLAGGHQLSLVAGGMLAPEKVKPPGSPGALSNDDLRYLKRIAAREREADEAITNEARALARRVEASALARKVRNPRSVNKPSTKPEAEPSADQEPTEPLDDVVP